MNTLGVMHVLVDTGAEWTRVALESAGALTIAIGGVTTIVTLVRQALAHQHVSFTGARFGLSRYLALALEFQLAADILETGIAPEWAKIGQLAAIAAIRTALNYFLSRELADEREQVTRSAA
jgi:uncharacterized membrane protein